jgi:hypothetical protein
MINYLASFVNTNSVAFPDTEAINATGPSTTDGTEFVKIMIDDEWGARQALMNYAGLTPDGVTEADGTSQFVEALGLIGPGAGIGSEWSLASDPAVTGHRALLRQGQGILRASYPDLDSAVYVGDGNNAAVAAGGGAFYRADNADGTSPNIAGVYLILDDYRGVVDRGLDPAASIDPDGAGRFLGDLQIDAFQGHRMTSLSGFQFVTIGGTGSYFPVTGGSASSFDNSTGNPVTDTVNGTPRTSSESRMYNRSVKKVIWY